MPVRLLCLVFLLVSGTAAAALPDAAAFRYHARQWSVEEGMPQVTASAMVQGPEGFMWVGTQKGLARFDGTRFKVFNHAHYPLLHGNRIRALAVDAAGRLWIGTNAGLNVYAHGHFVKLPPVPRGLGEVNALLATHDGLWIAATRGLFRIGKGQLQAHAVRGWTAHGADSLAIGPKGSLWVAVTGGVYGRSSTGSPFRFYPLPDKALSVHALARFQGQLWVGTSHGLYKLDHQHLQATLPRLAKRNIRALLEGPSHHLWIGTDESLHRLDAQGHDVDFSSTPGMQDKWIWSLARDRAGDIWAGTATHGMIRLWDNHVHWFGRSSGLTTTLVDSVYRDRDGTILVGGKSGAYRYRDGRFHAIADQADLPNPLVHAFLRQKNGQLWIGTIGGLAIMQSGKSLSLPVSLAPLAHANIYDLRQDHDGTVWIGTTSGLFRYRQGQLRRFGKQDGLQQIFVRGTYRSDHGLLWVGTAQGLYERSRGRFHRLCAAAHLNGPVLDVGRGTDGVMWIVSADGSLFRFKAGQCIRHEFKQGPLSGSLYYVVPDHHGNLWLTNAQGIYRIAISHLDDYTSSRSKRIPGVAVQTADGLHQIHPVGGTPQAGLRDPTGNFWVPTVNGMIAINLDQPPKNTAPAPVVIENIVRGSRTVPLANPPQPVTFAPGKTDLRIDYASLDFRTPESEHYRYRLSGYDSDWVIAGTRREALYTHIPPGHYRFEVRSDSANGTARAQRQTLDLTLKPLFYQTWWFYLVIGVLTACLVYTVYFLRMRHVHLRQARLETLIETRTEELQEANRKLQLVSMSDPLTGLKNRRFFADAVKKDIAAMRREAFAHAKDNSMVFLIMDLDNFKRVNDNYGHQAGDAVLTQLGDLLLRNIRESDEVIRWGGEEFLIVARRTDRKRAMHLAEKLRAAVADHTFTIGDSTTTACTCSIGFCAFPFVPGAYESPTWEGVINLADAALYKAKHRGKNAWIGVKPTDAAMQDDAPAPSADLDTLLEQGMATLEIFEVPQGTSD